MLKNVFHRLINILFGKKPARNEWVDISGNVPNWVKEKIMEIQNDNTLPCFHFKNKHWIIQGRYSIYKVTFINKDKYSAVHRKRKKKGIPAWEQYNAHNKLVKVDTKGRRVTVDQLLKDSDYSQKL